MKKTGKRLVAVALCLTVAASVGSMMGCGPRDSGVEPIDSTRTQLNIGTFGGGIGVEYRGCEYCRHRRVPVATLVLERGRGIGGYKSVIHDAGAYERRVAQYVDEHRLIT